MLNSILKKIAKFIKDNLGVILSPHHNPSKFLSSSPSFPITLFPSPSRHILIGIYEESINIKEYILYYHYYEF